VTRWEYKVVSLQGKYTDALNEHGKDGWELVCVAPDVHTVAGAPPAPGRKLPIPGALGRLEGVASRFGDSEAGAEGPPPGSVSTTLLWVLRRPLPDE
jgi:hypothetical protein